MFNFRKWDELRRSTLHAPSIKKRRADKNPLDALVFKGPLRPPKRPPGLSSSVLRKKDAVNYVNDPILCFQVRLPDRGVANPNPIALRLNLQG